MSADKHCINTLEQLRSIIPAPPAMLAKRILPALDEHCCNLIRQATLVAVGSFTSLQPSNGIIELLAPQHKLTIRSENFIGISLDEPLHNPPQPQGQPASLYFILPGIGYGLRVNGWLTLAQDQLLLLEVSAAYLQCTRAKVRANFWQVPNTSTSDIADANSFVCQSSYLLMLTHNRFGHTELSPRGDPQGFVHMLADGSLAIPERPGNKVAVSLRNILETTRVGLLFFMPGSNQLLRISGTAILSTDPAILAAMAIKGKQPKLAIVVRPQNSQQLSSTDLEAAKIWDADTHIDPATLPSFAKMMGEHMGGKGIKGKLSSALVDVVVKKDLNNLY